MLGYCDDKFLIVILFQQSQYPIITVMRGQLTSPEGVENQESLEPRALVRQLPDLVHGRVDNLLADGVVPPRVVVGRVLLPGHEEVLLEQLAVSPRLDLICSKQ